MLQVKNIKKEYKTGNFVQKALDDVSLNLRDNEFVAILGPSGSGKTTLLNIIGGLDRYDSGDLIINGISTKHYKDRDWDSYRNHTVGFIFQSYNLIPHQTILSNVELALTISGISGEERKKRSLDALEKVGLKGQEHKLPSQMSGGQMQRVAIARALVNNPDIVLADEPTGALDSATSVQVMDLLQEVAKDRLVVMVTHNPELAKQYATRIVVLKDGTIRSDSDPYIVEETEEEPVHKNMGKTGMSLFTSLSLSFNNLRTKWARTLLVSFAGSIGIIGIALILSLSNGVQKYIKDTEEETLSEYPLEIDKDSFSMTSMLGVSSASGESEERTAEVNEAQILGTMLSNVDNNDLKSLHEYLESADCTIPDYAKAIEYSYGITPLIYQENEDGSYRKVNPNDTFAPLGISSSSSSVVSSAMDMDVFSEFPSTSSLYDDQYDLKAGHFPENENECMLVLGTNGRLSDFVLYMIGVKDPNELDDYVETFANNESVTVKESHGEYTYEDFIGITFKVVNNSDCYTYDETYEVYSDRSEDENYMGEVIENGMDLTIVGVMEPKEDAKIAMLQMGVYYTPELVDTIRENAMKSEVVKAQLSSPDINVLTGNAFGESGDSIDMNELFSIDEERITNAFHIDTNALTINTSALENIDYAGAVNQDLINNTMPDLSADTYKNLFSDIHIQISYDGLKDTFTSIMSGYWASAEKNPSTDYGNLAQSMMEYFNTREGQQLLCDEVLKLIESNKENVLDTDTLQKSLENIFSEYIKQSNGDISEESFHAFINSEEGIELVKDAEETLWNTALSKMSFDSKALEQCGNSLMTGYIQYAQANGKPDPSLLQSSFETYMQSEEGKGLLEAGVKNSISNYDEIAGQLTSVYNTVASDVECAIGTVMQDITTNIGSQITSAMTTAVKDMANSIPNAFYVDGNALANSFSLKMDEEELQALMMSMRSAASASYQKNLTTFGYAEDEDYSEITIYPYDFEGKEEIKNLLDDYNTLMEEQGQEEKVITYTDLVGSLMSSVTDIINNISYILIAFVAISLVVSSIMIGVITYISVLERKKEIGILRAMGASKHNISEVFNAETFITGLLAGCIGIGLTLILIYPTNYVIHEIGNVNEINAYLEPSSGVVLILLSICLTLIGGIIPSKKAAKSDPVAALRSE